MEYLQYFILGGVEHWEKGSPMYPGKQIQLGTWLTALHSAFKPQIPGQGSIHLYLTHAK